ncbi:RNA polymerase II transcription factor SIII subunit A-domain-containing protein [Xylariaceae sp. FL0255]|nr:RNA polymerase II transcription factor SIII subunit A-domain-containing protein [Xylariaceae sp. FL0255]
MQLPKALEDVGNLPYNVIRPILIKIDSADQLMLIEEKSPHLQGDTEECWRRLINRDFRALAEQHRWAPKDPKSWSKVYQKYRRLDVRAKAEAQASLKAAFQSINKEKQDKTSKVVNFNGSNLPRPPRDVRSEVRQQASRGRGTGVDRSELRFTGGSRTKANTPQGLLRRARREAKEISSRNRLNNPVVRSGQLTQPGPGPIRTNPLRTNPLRTNPLRPPPRNRRPGAG